MSLQEAFIRDEELQDALGNDDEYFLPVALGKVFHLRHIPYTDKTFEIDRDPRQCGIYCLWDE